VTTLDASNDRNVYMTFETGGNDGMMLCCTDMSVEFLIELVGVFPQEESGKQFAGDAKNKIATIA
jgi:hypothetical protein